VSSFLIHALIPALIVLSLGLFRIRDVWIWSWAGWANDVDFLGWTFNRAFGWPNFHRALLHNVFLLGVLVLIAVLRWRQWERDNGRDFTGFLRARPGWVLVPYFYATHLGFDVFAGGITAFWPLSHQTFFWDFEIDVDTTKPIPQPIIVSQTGTTAGVPDVSTVYLWMTAEQFAIFLLYVAALGATVLYERLSGRAAFAWLDRMPVHTDAPEAASAVTARPRVWRWALVALVWTAAMIAVSFLTDGRA
jgi:hypothetical protein